MGTRKLNCFCCKKNIENIDWSNADVHPYNAMHFRTYGHYGSSVFDPMNGEIYIDIVICDECVVANKEVAYGSGIEKGYLND